MTKWRHSLHLSLLISVFPLVVETLSFFNLSTYIGSFPFAFANSIQSGGSRGSPFPHWFLLSYEYGAVAVIRQSGLLQIR
jgi:hypothetical protein